MGAEVTCEAMIDRKRAHGKALLETSEIIFRGDGVRTTIPFNSITSLSARNGALDVQHTGGRARFELGKHAAVWAEKIRNPKSLIDKLGVKPHHRISVIRVTDRAFIDAVAERAPDISYAPRLGSDLIFFQCDDAIALARLPNMKTRIKPDGAIWIITPKGKGGVKEADVMAAGKAAGLVDVKVAAFSTTHTAARYVIPKAMR